MNESSGDIADGGTDTEDDDDDFMVLYLALQCMDGGSGMNKPRTIPPETGIQWVERQLQDSDDCYDMFRMRRTVFRRLHETLVNDYGLTSSKEVCSMEALECSYGCVVHHNLLGKLRISFIIQRKLLVGSLVRFYNNNNNIVFCPKQVGVG
jgi:hypothetical protein